MNKFSYILTMLRKEYNLTQRDIANHLNISQQAYARYERGEREPNIAKLIMLANYYMVTVDYLIGFEFDPNSKRVPQENRKIALQKHLNNTKNKAEQGGKI